jgi:hypothetical protein
MSNHKNKLRNMKMSSAIKHLLLPTLFVITSVCDAQTVSNEILNGTKWEVPQTNPEVSVIMSYTKKTITEILKSKKTNKTSERSYRYYFTDEYPTKFDKKKVGKPNSGKYFCMLMPQRDLMVVQIYEMSSPDTLLVKSTDPKNTGALIGVAVRVK